MKERGQFDYGPAIKASVLAPYDYLRGSGPVKELSEQASALLAYKTAVAVERILPKSWRRKESLWDIFMKRIEARAGF